MRAILLRVFFSSLILLFFSSLCLAQEYYILDTEEAYTIGQGKLQTEIEMGVTKQSDASELFNIPTVRVAYGLSEWADIEIEYEYLSVKGTDFTDFAHGIVHKDSDKSGPGDARISLKVVPYEFNSHRLGFQFITKLPNADQDEGLGTNETDYTGQILFSSDWGKLKTHVNAGMAVLGDPSRNGNQNDFVVWGIGGQYELPRSLTLMGEVEGSFAADNSTEGFIENIAESSEGGARARVRVALTGPVGDWRWGVSAFKGVNSHTEDWGAQVGLSKTWGLGGPTEVAAPPVEPGKQPETYYNPLKTQEAYTIGERNFRTEAGFGYVNQPDDSDLFIIPDLVLGWGIGPWADVELEFQYLKVEDTFRFNSDGSIREEDINEKGIGDVRVKIKASPFETRYGRLGFQVVTKVPSAEDKDALGTDETDVAGRILFSTDWSQFLSGTFLEPLRTHINAGIVIQGDRYELSRQDDYLAWGLAAEYEIAQSIVLWGEIEGSTNGEKRRNIFEGDFGNSYAEARLGLTGPMPYIDFMKDWKWGVTASAGLTSSSRDWSANIGLSRTWGL
jgi:hypothetical protein